jgi:DNA ligase 1
MLTRRTWLFAGLALPCLPPAWATAPPSLMLAKPWRDSTPVEAYRVSEKFDGVRGYWDGQRLLTRQGRVIAVPPEFTAGWPAHPLDGELWAGRGRFTQAASAVARDRPEREAWRDLHYQVFDLPAHPGTFEARHAELVIRVAALGQPWVQAVSQSRVADVGALQALLKQTVANGGEGLMLHRADALYRGERSDALLKLKLHEDADALVVGQEPGRGKYAGLMGALWVQMPDGLRFRLGSGFSDDDRREPPRAGATVTYRFRGLNPSGRPRFATFLRERPD